MIWLVAWMAGAGVTAIAWCVVEPDLDQDKAGCVCLLIWPFLLAAILTALAINRVRRKA